MGRYLLSRLLRTVVVLAVLSVLVFLIVRASGDPVRIMLPPYATAEQVSEMRRALGLDRPLYQQYIAHAGRLLRADFGDSLHFRRPALPLVLHHFPATLQLALVTVFIAILIGFPLGILGAIHKGTIIEAAAVTLGVLGRTVPGFWLGIMLVLVFSVSLGWLPTSGHGGLRHLILPAATLSTGLIAQVVLLVRASMLEVLHEDYIRTAHAKGLARSVVYWRHALRNALISVITLIGMNLGALIGGAVIVEAVFSWPGIGMLAQTAVYARDFPLVLASVMLLAIGIIVINFAVDILYVFLDPRISYKTERT